MDKIVLTEEDLQEGGRFPKARRMTREQRDEFNQKGLNPLRDLSCMRIQGKGLADLQEEDVKISTTMNDRSINWILMTVYPEYDFNELPAESDELAAEVLAKSFVSARKEIKNSLTSESGALIAPDIVNPA